MTLPRFPSQTKQLLSASTWPQANTSPRISIITVVRNGASLIEATIQSVLAQGYANLEYIVIDGGSTDGTVDIIRRYDDHIDYWVSEPDKGISDAFNKGMALVSGELFTFLNAGDTFIKQTSVSDYALNYFNLGCPLCLVMHGDIYTKNIEEKIKPRVKTSIIKSNFWYQNTINHPGALFTYKLASEYLYDISLHIAMDYDCFLRMKLNKVPFEKLANHHIYMDQTGVSAQMSYKSINELFQISRRYYPKRLLFIYAIKVFRYVRLFMREYQGSSKRH